MYKTTIVIPCHNHYELTGRLLLDLLLHEQKSIDRIIIVDDRSTDAETIASLDAWKDDRLLPIEVEKLIENVGFTIASNIGLRLVACTKHEKDRIVFLISNDVRIHGKFIGQTEEILSASPKTLVGHKLLLHDTGWNTFNGRVFGYAEGYFLATTADRWQELGYFDPAYAPNDYEDVDLSTKAKELGFALSPLNTPNIVHLGGGTLGYNPEREAVTKRNREYFRKKWTE